jgi:hypothetical protein
MRNFTENTLVEQSFCPCCDRSIYFSIYETTEIVCRSCRSKYQIRYFKCLKKGFTSPEPEDTRELLERLSLQKLILGNRHYPYVYLKCQSQSLQQKYLVFCPSAKLLCFGSTIKIAELDFEPGDLIAFFLTSACQCSKKTKPVLLLNCTNGQILKFVSSDKPVSARLIEENQISLAIIEEPYWLIMLPSFVLGIIVFYVIGEVLSLSLLTFLIISLIYLLFLNPIFKLFLARRERQSFKETNLKLISEQDKLEGLRRLNLANFIGESSN